MSPESRLVNIAQYLSQRAQQCADVPAVIEQRTARCISYGELERRSRCLCNGLRSIGIRDGARTILMLPPGIDFFVCAFALLRARAVLVAADPGLGIRRFGAAIAHAKPQAFIGTPLAQSVSLLLRWGGGGIRQRVINSDIFVPGLYGLTELELDLDVTLGDYRCTECDPAAILFTSGSTGTPKGVEYSHGNFIAQVERLQELYGFRPGETDLATFPLFALFAPVLGMTAVIPDMNPSRPARAEPKRLMAAMRDYQVTTMFASPALLRRMAEYGHPIPGLRRVISAGAPVSGRVLRRFSALLQQDVPIHTAYGATEALPVSSISSLQLLSGPDQATAEGQGVCVGRIVADTEVRIIRVSDEAIPIWSDELLMRTGEVGEIVVRGKQVSQGYYARQQQTRLARIDCADDGCYHRMGDLGYFDAEGRLWFCGRKSQRLRLPDRDLYTVNCEGVFNVHSQVARSALVGVERYSVVLPVICVELERRAPRVGLGQLREELSALAAQQEHTRMIRDFLVHPGFPVDIRHNAKIEREKLALWATRQLR